MRNTIVGINSNKKSSIVSTMIMDISNAGMVVNGNMQTGGKMMVLPINHTLLASALMAKPGLQLALKLDHIILNLTQFKHHKKPQHSRLQMYNNSSAVKFQATIQENGSTVLISQIKFSSFASTLETVIINAKILKVVGNILSTTRSTALLMDPSSQVLRQMVLQRHLQVQL